MFICFWHFLLIFFFKQKTAYEMRISDWSSDVCSSDLNWTERVEGIDAGADDYLGKPFEMGELIARVRGVLRRAAGRGSNVVTAGRLRVDTQRMTVDLNGVPVRDRKSTRLNSSH